MSTSLMNFLFRKTALILRNKQALQVDMNLGVKACQTSLVNSLRYEESEQLSAFEFLNIDQNSTDILEKASIRAIGNLKRGHIDLPQYYRLKYKILDMKKSRFAEDYDGFKVASSVGGTKMRELNKLHAQIDKNERGELAHKLWNERKETDPAAKRPIGYF